MANERRLIDADEERAATSLRKGTALREKGDRDMQISRKTIDEFNNACSDFADAVGRMAVECFKALVECFVDLGISDLADCVPTIEPYHKALAEHPEWVHRANYSKKKRIRKKYHDRIMREYGERRK